MVCNNGWRGMLELLLTYSKPNTYELLSKHLTLSAVTWARRTELRSNRSRERVIRRDRVIPWICRHLFTVRHPSHNVIWWTGMLASVESWQFCDLRDTRHHLFRNPITRMLGIEEKKLGLWMLMTNNGGIGRIILPYFFVHFHCGKTGLHSTVAPPSHRLIKSWEGRISIPVFSPFLPSVVCLSKSKHRVTVPGASATPTNALKQRPPSVQLKPWKTSSKS